MSPLDKHEKKGKASLPRWVRNVRDITLVIFALFAFAVVAVLYIRRLPQPWSSIAHGIGILAVGAFIRSLAEKKA